jgi:50S ribosomal subunit-associated GTPase HflX
MIFVLNKIDLIEPELVKNKKEYLKLDENKIWIPISSTTGENILQLKNLINKMLEFKKDVVAKKSVKEEIDSIYGI